jgi:hypothetical protein
MPDAADATRPLDELISEAEQAAQVPVVDHPKPCPHVTADSVNAHVHNLVATATQRKCPTCLWWFCDSCASTLDPQFCNLCLTESIAELRSEPLVDAEGVQHAGRHITPTPVTVDTGFFSPRIDVNGATLCKTINEMSDFDLEQYVTHYKNLVQQAERTLDFRRVVLGTAQLESAQRKDNAARKLRVDRTKYPVKTLELDPKTGKPKAKPASAGKLMDMLQMLAALQALKQNKKKE